MDTTVGLRDTTEGWQDVGSSRASLGEGYSFLPFPVPMLGLHLVHFINFIEKVCVCSFGANLSSY